MKENVCISCFYYEKCNKPERNIKCMGFKEKEHEDEKREKINNIMLLSNNKRKLHNIPLWRKKDKRKRYYTRCQADEVIGAYLDYCYK